MFAEYEEVVLADYYQKMRTNALLLRFVDPTPAKLKRACILVLNERYSAKDHRAIWEFFELEPNVQISEQVIKRFDRDKFKPLSNYLKNPTINTDPKNIELLAWLIDFQPRPYEFGRRYDSIDPGRTDMRKEKLQENHNVSLSQNELSDSEGKKEKIIPQQIFSRKPYFNYKSIVVFALILIALIVSAMVYWLRDKKYPGADLTGLERCMYWTGAHYEPISCSQSLGDTLVIGLDSVRLYNLKKITNPDTITQNAIGSVWYIKRNGKLEFYTSGGYHPEDPKLRLRPVTEYIIKKYIKEGQMPD